MDEIRKDHRIILWILSGVIPKKVYGSIWALGYFTHVPNMFDSCDFILNVLDFGCSWMWFLEFLSFLNLSWDIGVPWWYKCFYWIHFVRSLNIWCGYLKSKWIWEMKTKMNDWMLENKLGNSLGFMRKIKSRHGASMPEEHGWNARSEPKRCLETWVQVHGTQDTP